MYVPAWKYCFDECDEISRSEGEWCHHTTQNKNMQAGKCVILYAKKEAKHVFPCAQWVKHGLAPSSIIQFNVRNSGNIFFELCDCSPCHIQHPLLKNTI